MTDWRASKYLRFDDAGTSWTGLTSEWAVFNRRGPLLGMVTWYGPWRQYVFESEPDCVFNSGCLEEIAGFCAEMTAQHKRGAVVGASS